MKVLDCGCGPGIITCDIADRIPNGRVVGIDADKSQVALASRNAEARSIPNVEFRSANVYDLPFPSDSFDSIFSHAVLEHLRNPNKAVEEFHRLLKAGGIFGVCSPDWGGFLLAPLSNQLTAAIDAYKDLQIANGGDVYVGRKFSSLLERIGFEDIVMHASTRYMNRWSSSESISPCSLKTPVRPYMHRHSGSGPPVPAECSPRRGYHV